MKKYSMWTILFINYSDLDHSSQFEDNIENSGYHTDIFDEFDLKVSRNIVTFIMTRNNEINYIGIAQKGGKVASKKTRFKIIKASHLKQPILKNVLIKELPVKFSKNIDTIFNESMTQGTPKFVGSLLKYIYEKNEDAKHQYISLMELFQKSKAIKSEQVVSNQLFEQEAISLSLQIAGMYDDYKGHFSSIREVDTLSFLKDLRSVNVREDLDIINDSKIFDDWNLISDNILSVSTFSNGFRELSIMYVNRTPIEENVGVDLIYIDEINKSFVMIQYKRLLKENSGYVYRPNSDQNFKKEKILMERFESFLIKKKTTSWYRYNNEIFYFKLCKQDQKLSERTLSSGMYLPKKYFDFLIDSKITEGTKGGKLLSYENINNFLNNTTFINLMKTGLIGSNYDSFDEISNIIKEILETGKSVILSDYRIETNV